MIQSLPRPSSWQSWKQLQQQHPRWDKQHHGTCSLCLTSSQPCRHAAAHVTCFFEVAQQLQASQKSRHKTWLCQHILCVHLQNHAQQKKPLTAAVLQAAIDNIRGAVMICYPQGLPEWDFVRQCLEEREDLSGTNVSMLPDCCTALRCNTCHASTPSSCTSSTILYVSKSCLRASGTQQEPRPLTPCAGYDMFWVPEAPRQLLLTCREHASVMQPAPCHCDGQAGMQHALKRCPVCLFLCVAAVWW